MALRDSAPATQIVWAIRGSAPGRKYGGGNDDQLPARGALGAAVRELVADGSIALASGFQTRAVSERDGSVVLADGGREVVADDSAGFAAFAVGLIGVSQIPGRVLFGPFAAAVYAAAVGFTALLWTLAGLALAAAVLAYRAAVEA